MSLLGKLMSQARKSEIGFGIHNNCVVLKADNEVKKNKDGEVLKRNSWTTIGQKNDAGEIVAEKEVAWFNLDPTSEYLWDNFSSQMEQMSAIVDTLRPPTTDDKDIWDMAIDAVAADLGIGLTLDELKESLKVKKTCEAFMKGVGDVYAELLEPLVGPKSLPVRFKVVYDAGGKYLQQPRYGIFVENMEIPVEDSRLKVSKQEEEYKIKSSALSSSKPNMSNKNI
jgi:hypothetical protein